MRKLKLMLDSFSQVPALDRIAFPSNLSKITLSKIMELKSKDMNTLGRIPNLQILKLNFGSCTENTLNCGTAGSFPRLQVFIMKDVEGVRYLTLEEGAMPRLRRVLISGCIDLMLNGLPERIISLGSNLEYVEFDDDMG
ncbi:hypothetical protein PIB30_066422 [Stylosanthes scabra]|uniref:Disease resistance R13L4/SHOC-2-like LRR domain-containing protein n=1 Tax=Stylosanthes scabra TaxID=79078 RepID=A0ABU6TPQ3_9FABA|nr:hypothetical protein [Stylosanthes scabra]